MGYQIGKLVLNYTASGVYWDVHVWGCAFDGTTISTSDPYESSPYFWYYCNYNAYLAGANPLPDGTENELYNVFVSGFNWRQGPLGDFYLPNNAGADDGTLCIDHGNLPANQVEDEVYSDNGNGTWTTLGLSFTAQANDLTPDSGQLDIGYHYPVMAASRVLVTGNTSITLGGDDPIQTYDSTDSRLIHSSVPSAAYNSGTALGRGLAILANQICYTEVDNGANGYGSDGIHFCDYGTEGSGSTSDSGNPIPNPDPRTDQDGNTAGIQDLTIHHDPAYNKDELYVLTGYGDLPVRVFEVDPNSGDIKGSDNGIAIGSPAGDSWSLNPPQGGDSDGFAVLANRDFLINDCDGGLGCATYCEYYGVNPPPGYNLGDLVPGGTVVDLSTHGIDGATGVAVAPDGASLYFVGYREFVDQEDQIFQFIIQTDLTGRLIRAWPLDVLSLGKGSIEDVNVVSP